MDDPLAKAARPETLISSVFCHLNAAPPPPHIYTAQSQLVTCISRVGRLVKFPPNVGRRRITAEHVVGTTRLAAELLERHHFYKPDGSHNFQIDPNKETNPGPASREPLRRAARLGRWRRHRPPRGAATLGARSSPAPARSGWRPGVAFNPEKEPPEDVAAGAAEAVVASSCA